MSDANQKGSAGVVSEITDQKDANQTVTSKVTAQDNTQVECLQNPSQCEKLSDNFHAKKHHHHNHHVKLPTVLFKEDVVEKLGCGASSGEVSGEAKK